MERVALGLGSNLGNCEKNILSAISILSQKNHINNISLSRIVETKALLLPNSPPSWDIDYINCVVVGDTELDPRAIFAMIKQIESSLGRTHRERWAPREIDIDLLVYGEQHIVDGENIVPHKGLLEREFAIGLLAEIWPDWRYPVPGINYQKTADELAKELP